MQQIFKKRKLFFLAMILLALWRCKTPNSDARLKSETTKGSAHSAQATGYSLYKTGNRQLGWSLNSGHKDPFLDQVQPILNSRCVACHGCYQAACQLNLQSYDLLRRGYNSTPLFAAFARPYHTEKTRQLDQRSLQEWRDLHFIPVVAHEKEIFKEDKIVGDLKSDAAKKTIRDSLLYQLLDQKQKDPGLDLRAAVAINRKNLEQQYFQCVATESQYKRHFTKGLFENHSDNPFSTMKIGDYKKAYSGGGMPLGLPGLSRDTEHKILTDWLEAGAKGPDAAAVHRSLEAQNPAILKPWIDFFNPSASDPKVNQKRHTARYLYEHLYAVHLSFEGLPGEFYEIVRATTPYGTPNIITEEIYQLPKGVRTFYYQIRKINRAIVQKSHVVWKVNNAKLERLKQLFEGEWGRSVSPPVFPVSPSEIGNPFVYFQAIPAKARSRFVMENAYLLWEVMTKGSICIGSPATYAVRDHTWIWLLNPDVDPSVQKPHLGIDPMQITTGNEPWVPVGVKQKAFAASLKAADLASYIIPDNLLEQMISMALTYSGAASTKIGGKLKTIVDKLSEFKTKPSDVFQALYHFARTSSANLKYNEAFEKELRLILAAKNRKGLAVTDIWTGSGDPSAPQGSPDAWINLTRHKYSSSMQYGSEGGTPQSVMLLSYSNFERIYYNLVATFKEWGSIGHKLAAWRHMSYNRLEGEDLFLSLLPEAKRPVARAEFTRGLGNIKQNFFAPQHSMGRPSEESFSSGDDFIALIDKVKDHLKHIESGHSGIIGDTEGLESEVGSALGVLAGKSAQNGAVYAQHFPEITYIRVPGNDVEYFTFLNNRNYQSHNIIFFQDQVREPERDTLSLYRGTVGAHPNVILTVEKEKLGEFVSAAAKISSTRDFQQLANTYGLSRKNPEFWKEFDRLHQYKATVAPGNDPIRQGIVDLEYYMVF